MNLKTAKIIFWITTTIIFLFEGVMPALTSQSDAAKQGLSHLGYPMYFGVFLTVFKVLGALALIIPAVPARVKEWAYAGFMIDFLSASISYFVVDGVGFFAFFPLIVAVILVLSYVSWNRMRK